MRISVAETEAGVRFIFLASPILKAFTGLPGKLQGLS
jgi:hypothetical protein